MATLALTIANAPPPAAQNLLRLEQEEWADGTGIVTRQNVSDMAMAMLFGGQIPSVDCGFGDAGGMKCTIHAYPAVPDLNYRLVTSTGILSNRVVSEIAESEGLIFDDSRRATLKYPATAIESMDWYGDVFDRDLNRIPAPTIAIEDNEIVISSQVRGVLIVKYAVIRHSYSLTVIANAIAKTDKFAGVVFGLFKNGIAFVKLDPPPNADSVSVEVPCGWGLNGSYGGSLSITGGGDSGGDQPPAQYEPPTDCSGEDRKIKIDYCSGVVMSDTAGISD